jgi:predicted DNA-binding protein
MLMSPYDPVPPNAVGLRVEVAPADRDRLKVAAAKAGQSMAAYVRRLIVEHLDELETKSVRSQPKKKLPTSHRS